MPHIISFVVRVPSWHGNRNVRGICAIDNNVAITTMEDKKVLRKLYEAEYKVNPKFIAWNEEKGSMTQYFPDTPTEKIVETITAEMKKANLNYKEGANEDT